MNVFRGLSIAIASVWLAVSPAWGETRAGEWSISPVIGGYVFESDQDLKHKPVYGLRLGFNWTSRFALEGAFDYLRTESTLAPVDVDGYLYRIEGLWHLMPEARVVPYLAAGLGVITLDPESGGAADDDFLVDYGAGAKWALNRTIGLRADVRHIMAQHNSPTYNNLEYTLGLVFSWGGAQPTPMAAAAPPPPPPAAQPAPPPPVAPVPLPPADEDRDGVLDADDRCPGTPTGMSVNPQGCPVDSDGDGVPDAQDRCPNTPRGEQVDDAGCPPPPPAAEEKVSIELAVEFDTNKADIKPQYQGEIQRVAEFMKTAPKTIGEVEGHTDNVGSPQTNVALSQRRADAVRKELIDLGVDASRLSAKGYGPSVPIADNKTPEGRKKNRRVMVTISGVK